MTPKVALVACLIGLLLTAVVVVRAAADTRVDLARRATTAAAMIDRDAVSALAAIVAAGRPEAVAGTPEFAVVREQLRVIRSANPDTRYMYLLGESQGRAVYLVDSEDEDSPSYSPPGQDFGYAPPQLVGTLKLGTPLVTGPALDQYGMWVSAMAPVLDRKTGKSVAVLGMDVAAVDWLKGFIPYVLATGAGSLLLLGLFVSTIRSGQKQVEDELRHYASHDYLTDVPNRFALDLFLREINLGPGPGERATVAIVDIDNFKVINDSLTHSIGDRVLTRLVDIIRAKLRPQDFVARLGGDEFAIVFPATQLAEARDIARSLREAVQTSAFAVSEQPLDLTVSIGLAETGAPGDAESVLSRADIALYAAKRTGRNKVVCYDSGLPVQGEQVDVQRVIPLVKSAISADTLVLHLQPIVDSATGDVECYEVLSRIKDEDGALIYPGVFLPVAEQFGLISELDRRVVKGAIALLEEGPDLQLFVNLSQSSVGDPEVLEFIRHALKTSWIDPSRLGFEISEAAAAADTSTAAQWIASLRSLGCPIALDDFGAGYSSFMRLGSLPVDYLKIHGSFVRDMDTEVTHKAFVQAMNDMAHAVGKKTVAEFVENDRVRLLVRELGVDFAQGYGLGRPAPVEEWRKSRP